MDNLLEVCEEMGLEVDYLNLKERGAFAFPMKGIIRAFNMSEYCSKTVTIVRVKDDVANMKMSSVLCNRQLHGENVLSAGIELRRGRWFNFLQRCSAFVELCEVSLRVEVLLPALRYN